MGAIGSVEALAFSLVVLHGNNGNSMPLESMTGGIQSSILSWDTLIGIRLVGKPR